MSIEAIGSTRAASAAQHLRDQILGGISQPGALLAEAAVAKILGVSRTPVREALVLLEREGLVEFSASGRAYVKDLTPVDFEELHVLRLTLEPAAARLAAPSLAAHPLLLERNLAETAQADSVPEITRLDLDFHELILMASGNARLLKLWRSLRGELELWLGRLHRSHQLQTRTTRDETVRSHREILDGFLTRPPADSERLMRRHILGWREWLPMKNR